MPTSLSIENGLNLLENFVYIYGLILKFVLFWRMICLGLEQEIVTKKNSQCFYGQVNLMQIALKTIQSGQYFFIFLDKGCFYLISNPSWQNSHQWNFHRFFRLSTPGQLFRPENAHLETGWLHLAAWYLHRVHLHRGRNILLHRGLQNNFKGRLQWRPRTDSG